MGQRQGVVQCDPDAGKRSPHAHRYQTAPFEGAVVRPRPNNGVTVNCAASVPPARSSTARISVTWGPLDVRSVCTTTSTASLTRVFNAESGRLAPASANWLMKRSRVSA